MFVLNFIEDLGAINTGIPETPDGDIIVNGSNTSRSKYVEYTTSFLFEFATIPGTVTFKNNLV